MKLLRAENVPALFLLNNYWEKMEEKVGEKRE